MKRKRRNYSSIIKAKLALTAIKGDWTLPELMKQIDVHPNQILDGKRKLLESAGQVFCKGKKFSDGQ